MWFYLVTLGIVFIDIYYYTKAPYPQRAYFWYKMPLGGIVAYLKFKNRRSKKLKEDYKHCYYCNNITFICVELSVDELTPMCKKCYDKYSQSKKLPNNVMQPTGKALAYD